MHLLYNLVLSFQGNKLHNKPSAENILNRLLYSLMLRLAINPSPFLLAIYYTIL